MNTREKEGTATPLLSVVTPAFNASRFVRAAYDCLRGQTEGRWEWVVVDDGSADDTLALLTALAERDGRVRVFHQQASGSAKQPRDHAVCEARTPLILFFDIDDRLSPDYVATQLRRQRETDADIVYPVMRFTDATTGAIDCELPVQGFDRGLVYEGRALVKETMPEWRIGCAGGLYRREVWVNNSWPAADGPVWMNSDEVDERLYLLQARRVAFSTAVYAYMRHGTSITTSLSPKLFHTLSTAIQLIAIADRNFGPESDEHRRAVRKLFYDWRNKMRLYAERHRELSPHADDIRHSLRQAMSHIDRHELTARERAQFLDMRAFPLLVALFRLRYRNTQKRQGHGQSS